MAAVTAEVRQPYQQYEASRNTGSDIGGVVTIQSESDGTFMHKHQEWRPGFWAQFPWSGIGSLVGVVVCSVAAVLVIAESNGKAKSEWKLHAAPNVLVSIFTSVSSILVTMAVSQGIAISWWRKAMKGATVEDLHNSWSFSANIMSIITGWKFFNVMALAALCTKFAIIDSTLFQKALSTRTALGPPSHIQAPTFPIEEFPATGILDEVSNQTAYMNYMMTFDIIHWLLSDVNINAYYLNGFYECAGLCGLTYRGIGFQSTCTMTNVSASRSQSDVESGANLQMSLNFEQRWPTSEKNYAYINMEWISWVSDIFYGDIIANTNCDGYLSNLTCELRPAVIDYPIVMRNSSYTRRASKDKYSEFAIYLGTLDAKNGVYEGLFPVENITIGHQVPNFTIVRTLDVPETQTPGGNTSIGGIAFALNSYYKSLSTVSYKNETDSTTGQSETFVRPVLNTTGMTSALMQLEDTKDGCPQSYDFDYNGMLQSINTMMVIVSDDLFLRSNYSVGDDDDYLDYFNTFWWNEARYVDTVELKDETYYVSKMAFAWGAFASTLVVIGLVLTSFWGFWKLGRRVTLGPFEIANAFSAPAFSRVSQGAGHVDSVLAAVGKEKVQYGAYNQEHGIQYYGFKGANSV